MRIDLSCPVENQGVIVKTNLETNEPYLLLKLFNLSERTIQNANIRVLAYGANGEALDSLSVTLENLSAQPKSYFAESKAISLIGMEEATHFVAAIDSVLFEDGTTYEPSDDQTIDTDESQAAIDDVLSLRQFVPEAVCFAKEHENYYRCVCGRANFLDTENCVRCGRNKMDMLEQFNSPESLNKTISKAKAEEETRTQEDQARIAAENEIKKAKLKKNIVIALITLVVAAIIAGVGVAAYRFILNAKAEKAFKNGDYLTAYENYQKTGSKKIAELTNYVQGATPENLLFQIGLIASDNEFVYYITPDNLSSQFQLVKENKVTKEKVVLTDSAIGSLNVTEDWVYYVDVENCYIKRISKDGQDIESVLDETVLHLSVIGNSLYYIKTDYDNPNGLSIEQCETLAAQGQMETFNHLYTMNADSKKTKLVSEENMSACYIYGSKIYYLTNDEDPWKTSNLCSIDLNGKGKEVIVDVPVASFLINGDYLFYVKMYNEAMKGGEIPANTEFEYTITQMNLKSGETRTPAEDYMVTYMNANKNKLFFIAIERQAYMDLATGKSEEQPSRILYSMDLATDEIKQLMVGDMQLFNVLDEDIIVFLPYQGMCKIKENGTGFEQLVVENQALLEDETEISDENTAAEVPLAE